MTDSRLDFQAELDELSGALSRMAALVTTSVETATGVIRKLDLEQARLVIDGDDVVDGISLDLEERCTRLLALQAPVASDLRAIVGALWIIADFERCGDLAVNIVKAARRLLGTGLDDRLSTLVERMSVEAVALLKLAAEAYAQRDAAVAAALPDLDDRLDRLHRQWLGAIFEAHRTGGIEVEAGVQLALVGRYYERLGDHAVNVGNRVIYVVTGWLPEHNGAARQIVRDRLRDDRRNEQGPDATGEEP